MKLIIAIILVLLSFDGFTQSEQKSNYWSYAIFYDQDYLLEQAGFKSLNEDRNYTMGLGLLFTFPALKHSVLMAPHDALNRLLGKKSLKDFPGNFQEFNSLMLANGTFTPDDLTQYSVVNNDRPYSSLTYLQTLITRIDFDRYRQYTSTFTAGVIGTFISREVQIAIHKSMNDGDTHAPRTPRGWSNQISNGGEPTLGYTYEEQRLLIGKESVRKAETGRFGLELKHGWKYSIGYYTLADYGLNFRLGKINPQNWTYMVNPLGSSNNVPAQKMGVGSSFDSVRQEQKRISEKKNKFELYTFGSLRPTFILYNALLNGQFKKSIYTLDFQQMRHLLLEFDGGIGVSVPLGQKVLVEIKGMISGRSPEFELPGRAPRWHYWGGLHLSVSHVD